MLERMTAGRPRGSRNDAVPCQDAHGRAGADWAGARTLAGLQHLDPLGQRARVAKYHLEVEHVGRCIAGVHITCTQMTVPP